MIIFGTRGVTTTPERGTFHCPGCGPDCRYARKRVRRFFTLYFIPVIPLDKVGEYIECARCKGTYKLEVLDMDFGADEVDVEAEFERAVRRVMVLVTLADGEVDDAEIATMARIHASLTGHEIREETLRRETRQAAREGRDVAAYLADVAPYLNDNGKELIVKAAMMTARADGHVDQAEMRLVREAAAALGMSAAHLRGVLADLDEAGM